MSKHKCPCCGYSTLPVPADEAVSYICPVCYWENDVFVTDENEPSDENRGLTLCQAQRNYLKYGACSVDFKEYTRLPTEAEK